MVTGFRAPGGDLPSLSRSIHSRGYMLNEELEPATRSGVDSCPLQAVVSAAFTNLGEKSKGCGVSY
jgi:hypothetical protein